MLSADRGLRGRLEGPLLSLENSRPGTLTEQGGAAAEHRAAALSQQLCGHSGSLEPKGEGQDMQNWPRSLSQMTAGHRGLAGSKNNRA